MAKSPIDKAEITGSPWREQGGLTDRAASHQFQAMGPVAELVDAPDLKSVAAKAA